MDSARTRNLLLLIVIYLAFVSLGLPDGTFGVAWPLMHQQIGALLELAGVVMTVGTLLTALAGFSSGWVLARYTENAVLTVSCAATSLGLLGLAGVHAPWFLFVAILPLGLGAGAVDAGLNGYVAKHYTSRHMNWLHACWGIGATGGPMILAQVLAFGGTWRNAFVLIAALQASMALVFLLTRRLWLTAPVISANAVPLAADAKPTKLADARSLAGWLAPLVFFFYVGVEYVIGLWTSSLLVVGRGASSTGAAAVVACYFGAITVGRILVGVIADKVGNPRLVRWGCLISFVGVVGFALSNSLVTAAAALIVAGLGLSPIYPCLMHEVRHRFHPDAIQTVIGRQSGGASLGAATMPALAGGLATISLEAIPWFAAAIGIALAVTNWRLEKATAG
ncbi:MFS transporter [Nibricoccus sp. IMCC34717]|uniref:MFS transporter n=1 Tax=Nibricoccus sp. IMCC34717 TaxID=3034021 RepID=UPI00384E4295